MSKNLEVIRSFMLNSNATATGVVTTITSDAVDEFVTYFDKNSLELQLFEMESALIGNTENKVGVVQSLFRDIHSLKGSAALLKIDPLTHLLHNLEDVLGLISRHAVNTRSVKKTEIFDYFLQSFDLTEKLVSTFQQDSSYVLKDDKILFGFYIRIINEIRSIAENINEYLEITEMDESMF